MKKEEFLAALAAEIRDLSKEDIARSLEYYGELVDERVEGGMSVEDAVNDLGGAEQVARQIMEELPRERQAAEAMRHGMNRMFDAADKGMDALDKSMDELGKRIDAFGREMDRRYGGKADDAEDVEDVEDEDEGERVYRITEPFTAVDVQVTSADVRLMRSGDGETHIETEQEDGTDFDVSVRDGVLAVTQRSDGQTRRKSTFFGIHFSFISGGGEVTIYLADEQWENISVRATSGDVEAEDVRARAMTLATKSGDVEARHLTVEGRMESSTMSGDLRLSEVTAGEVSAASMSGDLTVDEVEAGSLSIKSTSGDLKLEDTLVHGALAAESTSGDVSLRRIDARDLTLRSTSGDVGGTLLTPKVFDAHSVSGDVHVPQSDPEAGRCETRTTSGDISLRIAR